MPDYENVFTDANAELINMIQINNTQAVLRANSTAARIMIETDVDTGNTGENGLKHISFTDQHNNYFRVSTIGHSHAWDSITGKPTTFTPAAHTHSEYVTLATDQTITGLKTFEDVGVKFTCTEGSEIAYSNTLLKIYAEEKEASGNIGMAHDCVFESDMYQCEFVFRPYASDTEHEVRIYGWGALEAHQIHALDYAKSPKYICTEESGSPYLRNIVVGGVGSNMCLGAPSRYIYFSNAQHHYEPASNIRFYVYGRKFQLQIKNSSDVWVTELEFEES